MTSWLLGYALLGAFAGFIAGLFGVGGGLTIVPLLVMLFAWQNFPPEHVLHLALGTSMATIVLTSLSSMRAHHAHGAVRWDLVRGFTPGLLAGTFAGSLVAARVPTRPLAIAFALLVYFAAGQMILNRRPKPARQLPGFLGLNGVGLAVGLASSVVAAGGGFLTIPFMVWCNVVIHHAVGTSAALGFPIAVAGTIGFVVAGWSVPGLPGPHLGYIYLPAFVGVGAMTIALAPPGARVAHRLNVAALKRAFGVFLALLATKMAFDVFR
jgi:uncharacterized membrane protein YfcA